MVGGPEALCFAVSYSAASCASFYTAHTLLCCKTCVFIMLLLCVFIMLLLCWWLPAFAGPWVCSLCDHTTAVGPYCGIECV